MTSSDDFNVSFKFFSPLRPPLTSTLRSSDKKKKRKSSKILDTKEDKIKKKSKKEKRVTKDILNIVSDISDKLASKGSIDSDSVSIDLDIPPAKLKLLNARFGCDSIVSGNPFSSLLSDYAETQVLNEGTNMSKKRKTQELSSSSSPKKKHKSDKESQSINVSRVETDQDNTDHSDSSNYSPKKKHKSDKKGQSINLSRVETDQDRTDHSDSESDKNISEDGHSDSGNDSQESSTENDISRSRCDKDTKKTPKKIRCNIKPGFEAASKEKRKECINADELMDKELWLIQAPSDLNIEDLQDKNIGFGEINLVKIKNNEVLEVASSTVSRELTSFTPVLTGKTEPYYKTGCKFSGQICINRSMKVPHVPSMVVHPRPVPEIPNGLKPRYIPFGANSPVLLKKIKKSKKRKADVTDQADDHKKKHKKKKKKKKRQGRKYIEEQARSGTQCYNITASLNNSADVRHRGKVSL